VSTTASGVAESAGGDATSTLPPALPRPNTFHYFLRDVCMLLCHTWTEPAPAASSGGVEALLGDGGEELPPWPLHAAPATFDVKDCLIGREAVSARELAARFLTLLLKCAPIKNGYLLRLHLTFLGRLIQRWSVPPLRVRPDFKIILPLLSTADTTSRASLSEKGACIATGAAAIAYLAAAEVEPVNPG